MSEHAAAPDPLATADPGPRAHLPVSEPVIFDTFTGIFQAAMSGDGDPVLMLSPFGYEELCGRAFWAVLADRLAAAGIASLRFDFPGTANALDASHEGLEDWRAAAMAAADRLRPRTGRTHIAVLGQGLGATLAMHWAGCLGPLSAAVLLEPATSGRAYLRGLTAWGKTLAAASGHPLDAAAARDHAVAGFALPASRATAIGALDLAKVDPLPASAVLVLEQAGGSAGRVLLNRPAADGIEVVRCDFPGYASLNTDPTSAELPLAALTTVVDWLSARTPTDENTTCPVPFPPRTAGDGLLRGDGFMERPVRFGAGNALAGVLCLPEAARAGAAAVVIANAGRDHSIGWARSAVGQARSFARQGVASLRFDIAGVGDSRAPSEMPDEILYSDRMCEDLRAAVDHLYGLGFGSLGLVGRCSGAWAAFTVAAADPRIHHLALINTAYFLWDRSKTLADVIRFAQRNVGDLGATLLRRDGLRRLLKGQLDVRGAWRFLLRQGNRHLLRRCAPAIGRLTVESRRYHDLHRVFASLKARDVRVLLAYAEGDSSLDELRSFMGRDLGKLGCYPNVAVCTVAGADHNFTPQPASSELLARLVSFFGTGAQPGRARSDAVREAEPQPPETEPYGLVPAQL